MGATREIIMELLKNTDDIEGKTVASITKLANYSEHVDIVFTDETCIRIEAAKHEPYLRTVDEPDICLTDKVSLGLIDPTAADIHHSSENSLTALVELYGKGEVKYLISKQIDEM